jgi:hypothetical protein
MFQCNMKKIMRVKMKNITFTLLLIYLLNGKVVAQNCSTMNIQWQSDLPSTCNQMVMTMIHDQLGRSFLYVANKEAGLKIYDITNLASPSLVQTIPTSFFDTLDVMSLSQSGNYVYLALGNSFTNPQHGGMAIVDVTTPSSAAVTDYFVVPNSSSGGGIVKVENNYAYLGAMQSGLVILNVADKNNIQFVSQFIPDINFPPVPNPNPLLYNARGMEVRNSIVFLCYDGGGIRIINCTDKNFPVETGRWCNPVMYIPFDHSKAYNNAVLDDTLLYVAVDYCGMEVLNVSDTGNISMTGWWNPYNCPDNNWFTSPVHSNEIYFNKTCRQIFLSTGKSDLIVMDVADPSQPDSCNYYGGVSNSIGTWGAGIYQNQVYLSYICATIPFSSTWTGVKILTYDTCTVLGTNDFKAGNTFSIYPNPCNDQLTINLHDIKNINYDFKVIDVLGRVAWQRTLFLNHETFFINLPEGIYFYQLKDKMSACEEGKLIIQH